MHYNFEVLHPPSECNQMFKAHILCSRPFTALNVTQTCSNAKKKKKKPTTKNCRMMQNSVKAVAQNGEIKHCYVLESCFDSSDIGQTSGVTSAKK